MLDMPRPRPLHLHRELTRHGKVMWRVRLGHGKRIRLRSEYGTPEFWAEYRAAIEGGEVPAKADNAPRSGTLAWMIARYRETAVWASLSSATRRQRENIFKHVIAAAGHQPTAKITAAAMIAGRDRRAATPAQARNFLDAMRGLFRWAFKAGLVKADPTAGIDNPPRPKTAGFRPWTEADVEAYYRQWPLGTRQRVWLDVLLFTGLRRGDAVTLGRQHVRDGIAKLATEKTGVIVTLPILPVLGKTLEAGPTGDLAFIVGRNGKPMTKESFGNEFKAACVAAGVPGSAHGVRKIAATRAANAGATTAQLRAIFGWSNDAMPSLYTRGADRERLALEAMHKLATGSPTPEQKGWETGRKIK